MAPMSASLPAIDVPPLRETERLVGLAPVFLSDARTGAPPLLKTAVRVGLRGRILCVRFDGRDAGVVASYRERDEPLWKEDVFELFLAPLDPPAAYFEFEVNPLGTLFDARIHSPDGRRASMQTETTWDCRGFEAKVSRREGRWSASLRIPLDSLAADPFPLQWRANFYRIDRGEVDEYSAWSPTLADPVDFHVPERFGVLKMGFGKD